jgi:hypothetical protein
MLLKFFNKIPIIQCLTYFPADTHKAGAKKFFVLWLISSLPIIVAAVLSPIPDGDLGVIQKLGFKLSDAISVSEQFVYTASFLTPILYIIFEKYENSNSDTINGKLHHSLKTVFRGYGLIAVISLVVMFLTASAFSSLKTNPGAFKETFLNLFLVTYSPVIYAFALFCFYLSLLDGIFIGNFVEETRKSENTLKQDFAERLRNRGDDNGR